MQNLIFFIIGLALGTSLVLIVNWINRKQHQDLLVSKIKESFGTLSQEALSRNSDQLIKLANETLSKQSNLSAKELEGKKQLIDQTLGTMKTDLEKVQSLVTNLEKDREQKYTKLSTNLKASVEQTDKLLETTNALKNALANPSARGQWGERMAEDVLNLAGFTEGINYYKQKTLEKAATRPDYTFLLPQDLKVNMDVKFPLDNYLKYLEAQNDIERNEYKNQFLKDVKARIKEVTTKDYINPEENTVDYVIVFIPNEQVYSFINEKSRTIIDDALKNKVVLCSPLTLYAILAVIRQAIDNFNLEKRATKIMSILAGFRKQWTAFNKTFEKMGHKLSDAQKEFDNLTTTRRRQLEKPLKEIDDLREEKDIPLETSAKISIASNNQSNTSDS